MHERPKYPAQSGSRRNTSVRCLHTGSRGRQRPWPLRIAVGDGRQQLWSGHRVVYGGCPVGTVFVQTITADCDIAVQQRSHPGGLECVFDVWAATDFVRVGGRLYCASSC